MSHPTHWASPASTELTSVAFLLGLGYFFQHPRCRLRKAPLFFIFTFNFSRQLSRSRDCRFRRFSHNPTHYARRALDVCLRSLFLYRVSKRPCLRTRVRPNEAAKPERPCSWTHWVATATYIDAGRALFFMTSYQYYSLTKHRRPALELFILTRASPSNSRVRRYTNYTTSTQKGSRRRAASATPYPHNALGSRAGRWEFLADAPATLIYHQRCCI